MGDAEAKQRPRRNAKGQYTGRHATTFKPGESGNPKGRAPSLTTILKRILTEPADPDDPDGPTKAEVLMEAAVQHATNGKHQYFTEIIQRNDGKIGADDPLVRRSIKLKAGQVLDEDGGES